MGKMKDLYASGLVTSFLYGENHQKTQDINIIWEFANSFGYTGQKFPEDSMLMHTLQVILIKLNLRIESIPKELSD